jgi:RimJ/RimL family protein N-acetyltransferase
MDALPLSQLNGKNIKLLPFEEADITARYIDWLNDAAVVRFSNQRFIQHSAASCLAYLRSFDGKPNRFYSIRRQVDDVAIGTMTAYAAVHHGTVDLGIMIGEHAVWGKGYGQDAWDTLLQAVLATEGVRKITAGTLDCNLGMLRIFERSGMQKEAVRLAQEIVDGTPHDIVYYARFRDDC